MIPNRWKWNLPAWSRADQLVIVLAEPCLPAALESIFPPSVFGVYPGAAEKTGQLPDEQPFAPFNHLYVVNLDKFVQDLLLFAAFLGSRAASLASLF